VKQKQLIAADNLTEPTRKVYQSESGEVLIDGAGDRLVLDTLRTAGGYAPAGGVVKGVKGGVTIRVQDSDATVWVSAVDKEPIRQSRRLLVTHLTDLQNTDIKYAEAERKTLLDWGRMPHLVRAGRAEVSITLPAPERYGVWALAPSGRRLAEVPAATANGQLTFTADVAGDAAAGARMLYEVAVK
jgi:hypothetical protein